jgi:Fic family protein
MKISKYTFLIFVWYRAQTPCLKQSIMKNIWVELENLTRKYDALNLDGIIDYKKFVLFSLVHHSASIEGSTLTEGETEVLLDKGLTASGKPIEHSIMVRDCYEALKFVIQESKKKRELTPDFINSVNAMVMKGTGGEVNNALGSYDTSKGDYRLSAAFAQGGGYYLSPDKIPVAVETLCTEVNKRIKAVNSIEDKYKLSFDIHFNLVSIHPWGDGNGRTSRLVMNYVQLYHELPLTKVYMADRLEYINALKNSRESGNINLFRDFMCMQQIKFFNEKISELNNSRKKDDSKGVNLMF